MAIEIRPVQTIEEAEHVEKIIAAAWDAGPETAIPDHLTITMAGEKGGVVLLAWDGERPVGFCWGFLAWEKDGRRLKHCSHMAGVIPAYRGRQVGERLKWAQRAAVLALELDHITWTYDPLETLNGRLNLHKLGAVAGTYKRNVYGDVADGLNSGLPTDRFHVDWWIASLWVEAHYEKTRPVADRATWEAAGAIVVNPPGQARPLPLAGTIRNEQIGQRDRLLVAVPSNFQRLKQSDMAAALAWRLHTRALFEALFSAGYTAVDLLVENDLCYYLCQLRFNANRTD